jgi:hypothetical protein
MVRGLSAIFVLLQTLVFAHAQGSLLSPMTCRLDRYSDESFRMGRIDRLISILRTVVEPVEGVPPLEADFIRNELDRALRAKNQALYNSVTQNKFYRAFEVKKTFETLIGKLVSASQAKSARRQAQLLIDALQEFPDFATALNQYADFDRARSQPMFTIGHRDALYVTLGVLKQELGEIARCIVGELREP